MQPETSFFIEGPAGDIEAAMTLRKEESQPRQCIGIICHPHPQQGGKMTNKVVTTLARTFADLGVTSVRFNFRGVGKSAGTFADGVGEIGDLLAVIVWVKAKYPQEKIWLGGFSFGAAISAHAATRVAVEQLVSIAPPVPRLGLLELPPVTCPWLIVQGDKDDVVVPQDVYAWVETRVPKPKLIRMENAGHFFHGELMELRRLIEVALT